jgi:hypothetical protein
MIPRSVYRDLSGTKSDIDEQELKKDKKLGLEVRQGPRLT